MRQELFKSYQQTLEGMDTKILYPFSEFQVQPLFAQYWVNHTHSVFKSYLDQDKIPKFINPSVTRSMYITDLLDCYYADVDSRCVHEFYHKVLTHLYTMDPTSIESNLPIGEHIDVDFMYYKFDTIRELLAQCFAYAYAKNFDIMADNTYEVLGPFFFREFMVIKTKFHNIFKEPLVIYSFGDKKSKGRIDLFGHSTYSLEGLSCSLGNRFLFNQEILKLTTEINDLTKQFIRRNNTSSVYALIFQYLKIRKSRYKFISFYPVEIPEMVLKPISKLEQEKIIKSVL